MARYLSLIVIILLPCFAVAATNVTVSYKELISELENIVQEQIAEEHLESSKVLRQ